MSKKHYLPSKIFSEEDIPELEDLEGFLTEDLSNFFKEVNSRFLDSDPYIELGNPSSKQVDDMMRSSEYVGKDISNGFKLRNRSYR